METFGLGEWIEREFGVRGERLSEERRGPDDLDHLLATQERAYRCNIERLAKLSHTYEEIVKEARGASEAQIKERKAKAKKIKKEHDRVAQRVHKHGLRIVAIVAVGMVRDLGTEELESDTVESRLHTGVAATVVGDAYLPEYRTVVANVLQFGYNTRSLLLPDHTALKSPFDRESDATDASEALDEIDLSESSDDAEDLDILGDL
ncbi:hypothetical protein [Halomicrobium sp. LC1Hm]|uniref:hypothetical protein n=1 Tax=Halomicrobium sp. LC1Hm TaxID=2610902 RepID=UPI0012984298|nr:hypothetical protein [Halomicrobium sp. LC1Hm]QGA84377.1 hypothetical protein LC1Hm_4042 [Halomicrobium sp. LC1Hm]